MKERRTVNSIFRPYRKFFKRWRQERSLLRELSFSNTIQFSQFGEDVLLNHLFDEKNDGFYVDAGAFHPYKLSNTYLFYKKGWRGINIEPNPAGFREFTWFRPKDINVNCAIAEEEKEVSFVCDGACSGIDGNSYIFKGGRKEGVEQITINARPLKKILEENMPDGQVIDFMSIDCEGLDEEVIRSNDWDKFRPRVLLVEDHDPKRNSKLCILLEQCGYEFHYRLKLTKIFVEKDSFKDL